MASINDLNRKRGTVKGRITKAFNSFQTPTAGVSILTPGAFKTFVKDRLQEIEDFDNKIVDHFNEKFDSLDDESEKEQLTSSIDKELDDQTEYILSITSRLETACQIQSATNCTLKLPELKCDNFTGEGVTNLEYFAFITKFNNVIGLRPNLFNATKFTYLKTYLKGYALKLVQHLHVTDDQLTYITMIS